jgi:hypothetical protein
LWRRFITSAPGDAPRDSPKRSLKSSATRARGRGVQPRTTVATTSARGRRSTTAQSFHPAGPCHGRRRIAVRGCSFPVRASTRRGLPCAFSAEPTTSMALALARVRALVPERASQHAAAAPRQRAAASQGRRGEAPQGSPEAVPRAFAFQSLQREDVAPAAPESQREAWWPCSPAGPVQPLSSSESSTSRSRFRRACSSEAGTRCLSLWPGRARSSFRRPSCPSCSRRAEPPRRAREHRTYALTTPGAGAEPAEFAERAPGGAAPPACYPFKSRAGSGSGCRGGRDDSLAGLAWKPKRSS